MGKRILLIYNPMAGRGVKLDWVSNLCRTIEEKGYSVLPHPTSEVESGYEICNRFYEANDIFMVIGGDGTINSVIQRLANQDKPVLIVPMGTANVLGKVLKIKLKRIDEIISCLEKENIQTFPICEIDDGYTKRFFFLMAGIGFDAVVVENTKKRRSVFNKLFFVKNSLKTLYKYDFPQFEVKYKNGEKSNSISSRFLVVSNVEYYAGKFRLCKNFDIKKRKLCLCSFEWGKKIRGLLYFFYLLRGNLNQLKDVRIEEIDECEVLSKNLNTRIPFQIDGERGGKLPVKISTGNNSVNLFIP